jgi:hypothetical protein
MVLSTDDVPCVHSRADVKFDIGYGHGLADPGAACLWPTQALEEFTACPIIIVVRDPDESRQSFQNWIGDEPILDEHWNTMVENYERFRREAVAYEADYDKLDDTLYVQGIAGRCGVTRSKEFIDHMQLLHVEQSVKCLI